MQCIIVACLVRASCPHSSLLAGLRGLLLLPCSSLHGAHFYCSLCDHFWGGTLGTLCSSALGAGWAFSFPLLPVDTSSVAAPDIGWTTQQLFRGFSVSFVWYTYDVGNSTPTLVTYTWLIVAGGSLFTGLGGSILPPWRVCHSSGSRRALCLRGVCYPSCLYGTSSALVLDYVTGG